ncbi:MAG: cysteine hydrolase [Ectothiorhodospiraceae bacterium]|nr:cysteine hydrolase [Ectothiorhodospiraceae bacterium]
MENTALIIIDIQNDYFPGGAMALEQPEQAAQIAARLLSEFRERELPVIHIQQENINPDLAFMLPGSDGQKIHKSVEPLATEPCFIKHYPNAFWQTELEAYLHEKGIKHIVIAGMMTHMCVSATTRSAMERGFTVTIIQDACATLSLSLDGVEIPAETVQRTALAELTLLAAIKPLQGFLTEHKKPMI